MYIKEEDFGYLTIALKTLNTKQRELVVNGILKEMSKKLNTKISVLTILTDEVLNTRGIEPEQIVTKTLIKKIYKEIKNGG
jgi:hypothetical protein